jgi:hypothetical protein
MRKHKDCNYLGEGRLSLITNRTTCVAVASRGRNAEQVHSAPNLILALAHATQSAAISWESGLQTNQAASLPQSSKHYLQAGGILNVASALPVGVNDSSKTQLNNAAGCRLMGSEAMCCTLAPRDDKGVQMQTMCWVNRNAYAHSINKLNILSN